MPNFLSPIGNGQTFDSAGDPLTGGQIETYLAGSTTPAATSTTSIGDVSHSNPIYLDSLGYPPSPIWLAGGTAYKFIIKNALGVTLKTIDGISGVNDSTLSVSEWVSSGFVPTYVGATSFSVPGDQRTILQVGRRIRTTNTAGIVYSGISVSSFGAGVTTVTVVNDSGTLDSGLSIVEYGLISATNTSFPFATFSAASTIALTNDATTNAAHYLTFADGTAGQENLKTDTAKLAYNPSTGALSASSFVGPIVGSGAGLTAGSVPRAALAAVVLSEIRVYTANGFGSTATRRRRFSVIERNVGADITYADSSTAGATFTINANGVYAIAYADAPTTTSTNAITRGGDGTTSALSLSADVALAVIGGLTANRGGTCSWTGYLAAGAVISPQVESATTGAGAISFSIVKVS